MKFCFSVLAVMVFFLDNGVTGVYANDVLVSAMAEDSVTLQTGVIRQQKEIKWYFNATLIAQIKENNGFNCTDVQCNEETERFTDRLKLDPKTGSLTIMNIRNTDSGLYHMVVNGRVNKIFNFTVHGGPAAHHKQVNISQGESATFNPDVRRGLIVVNKCFFNEILIAEITVNQSQICTDVQCKERFADRLKLDSETASLTITNTRSTDSGNYTFQIFIRSDERFSITREKKFSLTVSSPPPSHLSGGAIAGIVVVLFLVAAAAVAAVIYYLRLRNSPAEQQDADNPSNFPLRDTREP